MGVAIKRYDLRYDGARFILVGRYSDEHGLDNLGQPAYWQDEATCKDWLTAKELLRLAQRETSAEAGK